MVILIGISTSPHKKMPFHFLGETAFLDITTCLKTSDYIYLTNSFFTIELFSLRNLKK